MTSNKYKKQNEPLHAYNHRDIPEVILPTWWEDSGTNSNELYYRVLPAWRHKIYLN